MLHALITRAGYKERFELTKYAVTHTVMPPHGAPSTGSPNKAKRIAGACGVALRRFSVDDGRTRLFLSYPRGGETTPFARKVKDFLESKGFAVWLDEEGIAGGVDFMNAIGEAIKVSGLQWHRRIQSHS